MSFKPGGGSMLAGVAASTALLMKEEMGYDLAMAINTEIKRFIFF